MRILNWRRLRDCEGSAMVEFAVSCLILIPIFFGFIETCLAFYTYNFVSDAAREASRYAMVRGSSSCANLPSPPGLKDCGFTTSAPLQTYVQGLGYPGLNKNNLVVTVSWLRASTTLPTTWTTTCICNQPGNQVRVQVRYNFPIGIPFWRVTTISIGSVSSMVISQ
jgi:Flp pilus assembly protein TadG